MNRKEINPQELVELYRKCGSTRSVAHHYGISSSKVQKILELAGEERGPCGRPKPDKPHDRVMIVLRKLQADGNCLPKYQVLRELYGGDVDHGLSCAVARGLLEVTLVDGMRHIKFLQEPFGELSSERKHGRADIRYKRVYQNLLRLANSNTPCPSLHELGRTFGCEGRDAMKWLAKQGLISVEITPNVGTNITICATGAKLFTRKRGKREYNRDGYHTSKAVTYQPRPSEDIWGEDLAPDATFLRKQGDVLEIGGMARDTDGLYRNVEFRCNGRGITAQGIHDRAERIRGNLSRLRDTSTPLYAARY